MYHETELWLERLLQYLKSKTKYQTTCEPEKVMGNLILVDMAMAQLQASFPMLKTFDDWIPEYRDAELTGPQYDDDYESVNRMLFPGKRPAVRAGGTGLSILWDADVKPALQGVIEDAIRQGNNDFQVEDLDEPSLQVWLHTAAYVHNDEIITSKLHGRSRTRESHYVLVEYGGTERIAEVVYFARLVLPTVVQGVNKVMRVAVCDLFKQSAGFQDADIGTLRKARVHVGNPNATYEICRWAIQLAAVTTKVVAAKCPQPDMATIDIYFQTTSMASGLH